MTYGDDFVEVATSRSIRRYLFTNGVLDRVVFAGGVTDRTYDDRGNLIESTDALGHTSHWTYNAAGQTLSATNSLGDCVEWELDSFGRALRETRPDSNVIEYVRDSAGSPIRATDNLGLVIAYQRDSRGLVTRAEGPNGEVTEMGYDAAGNRVYIREPNGGERHIRYDSLGNVVAHVDEVGGQTSFRYGANRELLGVTDPDGSIKELGYDRDGNLVRISGPQGTQRLMWGGYASVWRVVRPDGTHVDFRYDREGDMVRVINEEGLEHTFKRDSEGRVLEETTFDGRTLRFWNDDLGKVVRMESSAGMMEVVYDGEGRIVERTFDDEVERFEYDWAGNLIAADNGLVRTALERDVRGRILRETQTFSGKTSSAESIFAGGHRVQFDNGEGYATRVTHTTSGVPLALQLPDSSAPLEFTYDPRNAEVERRFPGGGRVTHRFDGLGRIQQREVLSAGGTESAGEPQWVGRRRDMVLEQYWDYASNSSRPHVLTDSLRGEQRFAHDAQGQLLERTSRQRSERFSYSLAGSVSDARGRVYAPGGRLLSCGNTTYQYDDANRVIAKKMPGGKEWTYEWNEKGLLKSVTTEDSRTVSFVYDCFARRVEKSVTKGDQIEHRVEYRWDSDRMVQAITVHSDGTTSERRFGYLPHSVAPIGHQDVRDGLAGEWVYYVNEASGRPDVQIDGAGRVVALLESRAFGELEPIDGQPTPVDFSEARFAGHWRDEETGLFYNRWRFYDPDTALYISPEPVGIQGGLHAFRYAMNRPLDMFDPDGLMFCDGTPGLPPAGNANSETYPNGGGPLNPIVAGCLANPRQTVTDPAGCAEPRYLSNHLNSYTPPITHDSDPRLKGALNDFKCTAYDENRDDMARAPCPNCSQLFANLMSKYGAPNPSNIGSGAGGWNMSNSVNFTGPRKNNGGFASYADAKAHYNANNPNNPWI
ncbi:MAG: RHS repeat protein [Polyangiaceae bacterium]|nr:RHS repeat protein [Polyangiaceae bacterium]